MRIYVASASGQWRSVRIVQERCRQLGHTITEDWTVHIEANPDTKEADVDFDAACAAAEADRRGVRTADLVIFLYDSRAYGGVIEAGMALAFGVPLWVVGHGARFSIFWTLPDVTSMGLDEMYERLANL